MRERLTVFALLFTFWMLVMSVARVFFLLYNHDLSSVLTFGEISLALLHGLKMDMSISGYAMALIGLLLTTSTLIRGRWISIAINIVVVLLVVVTALLVIIDAELYRHWGFRMNTTPLFYMGSEATGSVDPWVIVKLVGIGCLLSTFFLVLYFKNIAPRIVSFQIPEKKTAGLLLLVTASMFMCIRGSFSVAPMNTGFVYFHETKMYANHAAINVVWNFFKSLSRTSHVQYDEKFFDEKLTEKYFNQLYTVSDSTVHLFNTAKPNVLLIIVESYTANVIEVLGGMTDVSPRLNALCKEGILFDNFYASGERTDKGLVSVLSGYPAQPNSSIIKYPQKTQHLPYLNQKMKELGYSTSFVYGGDADFANFRSYIASSGFSNLTEVDDFDDALDASKWGVHDGFMLQRALQEIDTASAPYFKVILTQSSHEPYDVPMKPMLPATNDANKFVNACHYTDSCLGAFIDKLKATERWKNTVVLITADHGHRFPNNVSLQTKERFHIPFLIIGGAVTVDSVIHTVGGQTDIVNTLLAQLDKVDPEFLFSKNLLSTEVVPHAAFYFTDGYGFVLPNKFLVYDNVAKKFIKEQNVTDVERDWSKAYQQKLYSDFNKR
jgi:phosphoglycerol transferase MdoB-like AlkP superfamily enzyme